MGSPTAVSPLSDEIVDQICRYADESSLVSLGKSSQQLRSHALPFLYQSLSAGRLVQIGLADKVLASPKLREKLLFVRHAACHFETVLHRLEVYSAEDAKEGYGPEGEIDWDFDARDPTERELESSRDANIRSYRTTRQILSNLPGLTSLSLSFSCKSGGFDAFDDLLKTDFAALPDANDVLALSFARNVHTVVLTDNNDWRYELPYKRVGALLSGLLALRHLTLDGIQVKALELDDPVNLFARLQTFFYQVSSDRCLSDHSPTANDNLLFALINLPTTNLRQLSLGRLSTLFALRKSQTADMPFVLTNFVNVDGKLPTLRGLRKGFVDLEELIATSDSDIYQTFFNAYAFVSEIELNVGKIWKGRKYEENGTHDELAHILNGLAGACTCLRKVQIAINLQEGKSQTFCDQKLQSSIAALSGIACLPTLADLQVVIDLGPDPLLFFGMQKKSQKRQDSEIQSALAGMTANIRNLARQKSVYMMFTVNYRYGPEKYKSWGAKGSASITSTGDTYRRNERL